MEEYLTLCKEDHFMFASPAERLLKAIGDPVITDSRDDPRLGRIFGNRKVTRYPAFKDFYGMEETIESVVAYLKHNAQGLEESKQILYLLGPVGAAKSSLAEKIKELVQKYPVYVLMDGETGEVSPVFENPLGLFKKSSEYLDLLEEEYGIPRRACRTIPSPWANQKLEDFDGDISKFRVKKMLPSILNQACVAKVEPGDENNQDISALVGKVDIRKLEDYQQSHPYAYGYNGGLNRANQGIMEFVEMFKASIKTLNPLLTASQEKNYNGTEPIGGIPFDGIILAHSNESEWESFKNSKVNEAFIDRIVTIKVPYCLRVTEEIDIYKKLLNASTLADAPCAPDTLKFLAQFCILTRLKEHENSTQYSKMKVYDGENIKDTDPKAKPIQEYKDLAGVNEGMNGMSTRFAFKILSKTFNFDGTEIAANPVHLMYVLENAIMQEQFSKETTERYINYIKSVLVPKYLDFLEKELRVAYLDSYGDVAQNIFDRYLSFADAWLQDGDFRDPATHVMMDREQLNKELEAVEKTANIANPKDFRSEIVNYALRYKANHGKSPAWNAYEKIKDVIEKKMFASTEELLPVISFDVKQNKETEEKHKGFVERMVARGYTENMVRLLSSWYIRMKKSS
jgi:serine protein kinase